MIALGSRRARLVALPAPPAAVAAVAAVAPVALRPLLALLALLAGLAGGCTKYIGGSRPVDPARLAHEPGWIVVDTRVEVQQREASDCGPAALAMVAAHWGVALPLDEASRRLPEPTDRGIRLADLRVVAREEGLDAYAIRGDRAVLEHELREGRPVLVGLLLRHRMHRVRSHFEVVVALHPQRHEVVTIDPAAGYRVRRFTDLDEEWEPAGRPALVVLGPIANTSASQAMAPLVTTLAP